MVLNTRLANALLSTKSQPLPLQALGTTRHGPLAVLLDNIYFLPLDWRKFLLEACRIQKPFDTNSHIQQLANPYINDEVNIVVDSRTERSYSYHIKFLDVYRLADAILVSHIAANILSFFVRAERSHHVREFSLQRDLSFNKEFTAATYAVSVCQRLNYAPLFEAGPGRLHPQLDGFLPPRVRTLFEAGVRRMKSDFCRTGVPPILPAFNSRKNIAYQTQRNYEAHIGYELGHRGLTTLDLLKLYTADGTKIHGPMEIRQAWFFNDLKPRTYYTNGGDSYFSSLYVQPIANMISKFLPSTDPEHRFDVSRVGTVRDDMLLITYDYTSFTSSLSELKYFLFFLGYALKGIPIDVYDPFAGVLTLDLGELLLEYNTFANHNCLFSVERFDGKTENPIFSMGQAGALGIKGNIVFSTSLHGFALADLTGSPDRDCVVGDDALTSIFALTVTLFVMCVNNLGEINRTKFSTVLPRVMDPMLTSSFKFTKRPLSLDVFNVPCLGTLEFFPDVATILYPEGDGFHTPTPGTDHFSRVEAFVQQVSRYSLIVSRQVLPGAENDIYRDDQAMAMEIFRKCYDVLNLPFEGAPPGYAIRDPTSGYYREMELFIPPVDTDILLEIGWVDVCYGYFSGTLIIVPQESPSTPPPLEHYVGQTFLCTSDFKLLKLLESLEYISTTYVLHTVYFDDHYRRRLLQDSSKTFKEYEPLLKECFVIKECPHYFDLVQYLQADRIGQDIIENLSIVSTLGF